MVSTSEMAMSLYIKDDSSDAGNAAVMRSPWLCYWLWPQGPVNDHHNENDRKEYKTQVLLFAMVLQGHRASQWPSRLNMVC